VSIVVLLFTYACTTLRSLYCHYKLRSNAPKHLATTDDESSDSNDQVFVDEEGHDSEGTLIDALPQDTKMSVIEDRPPYERAWVAAEVTLLVAQIVLSIFSIITGEGWRGIAVAGHVQWVYLIIVALLRFLGTTRTKSLWTHSLLIYLFSWPIALLLLRSAILHHANNLGMQIINFCLVTGLCALVLTSRAGNKPVKLVSTNGLVPTRVRCFLAMFIVGTNSQLVFACDIQLGGSCNLQRMVTYLHCRGRLGFTRR
jgi:hypothetical protein